MKKYCFLILHYKTDTETKKCIESIINLNHTRQIDIYVVDNFSNNGSLERLTSMYKDYPNIKFVKNKQNVGFSRGNNLGYSKIFNRKQYQFLIVCNNDIYFKQHDFLDILDFEYEKANFDVAGPDIYVYKKYLHQNPIDLPIDDDVKANKDKEVFRTILQNNSIFQSPYLKKYIIDYFDIFHIYNKLCNLFVNRKKLFKSDAVDIRLYGACLIFSNNFLKRENRLFSPETPFYGEEEILQLRCHYSNYIMKYLHNLQVLHEDGGATKYKYHDLLKREKFIAQKQIEAKNIYIKYYTELQKNNLR